MRQRIELQHFGDAWQKATVWRLAGFPRLQPQGALDGNFPSLPHSVGRGLSVDERERQKAAFTLQGHSDAVASQWCTRRLQILVPFPSSVSSSKLSDAVARWM